MARSGITLLASLLVVSLGTRGVHSQTGKHADTAVVKQVKIQSAIYQGKYFLLQLNDPAKAVEVLEQHLAIIEGDRSYLELLRNAYIKHIINLHLSDQQSVAKTYINRLRILDPQAADRLVNNPSEGLTKAGNSSPESVPISPAKIDKIKTVPIAVIPVEPTKKKGGPTFRANDEQETIDPFSMEYAQDTVQPDKGSNTNDAKKYLSQAEKCFSEEKYQLARAFYQKAHQADKEIVLSSRDRWAYCEFQHVVEKLNEKTLSPAACLALEKQVQSILALEPNGKLGKTGHWLLQEIAKRKNSGGPNASSAVQVKHLGRNAQGWEIAETSHFRVYHNQSRSFAEQVARVAENTRQQMAEKWFGPRAKGWKNKCSIYLHATAKEYSKRTGVHPQSPGHSRIESDRKNGEVISRQIELRCDNPDLLNAVLPHETTHVVLAGQFGTKAVPRWVDEGVAVLTEPRSKVNLHLQNLGRFHKDQKLFHVQQLIELSDYPHPQQIGAFYAQSVSLVEYLTGQRGPQVFTLFVADGMTQGYESALRKHYGVQSFDQLQSSWLQYVVTTMSNGENLAQK